MLEKEKELQRNLGSKEEKLQKLKEHQLNKEESLSEKEKQLQEMRERTRRMLEKSRQKEQDFEASTQSFNETIKANEAPEPKRATMKDKLKSKVSDKAKGMTDMAKAMKEEMRRKREEAKKDEEDDLLSFLRNSHKKKVGLQNQRMLNTCSCVLYWLSVAECQRHRAGTKLEAGHLVVLIFLTHAIPGKHLSICGCWPCCSPTTGCSKWLRPRGAGKWPGQWSWCF